MKNILLTFSIWLLSQSAFSQDSDHSEIMKQVNAALWPTFEKSSEMINNCALKIAHGIEFDRNSEWPAYCNAFGETDVVTTRVNKLQNQIDNLQIPETDLAQLAQGKIWIGAPAEYAELSWGLPSDINRTITESQTREQWVYEGGYLYITNGKVSGMQN